MLLCLRWAPTSPAVKCADLAATLVVKCGRGLHFETFLKSNSINNTKVVSSGPPNLSATMAANVAAITDNLGGMKGPYHFFLKEWVEEAGEVDDDGAHDAVFEEVSIHTLDRNLLRLERIRPRWNVLPSWYIHRLHSKLKFIVSLIHFCYIWTQSITVQPHQCEVDHGIPKQPEENPFVCVGAPLSTRLGQHISKHCHDSGCPHRHQGYRVQKLIHIHLVAVKSVEKRWWNQVILKLSDGDMQTWRVRDWPLTGYPSRYLSRLWCQPTTSNHRRLFRRSQQRVVNLLLTFAPSLSYLHFSEPDILIYLFWRFYRPEFRR